MILSYYAGLMLILWLITSLYLIVMSRKITYLKEVAPHTGNYQPAVAIIIAVRNEEAEVEEALHSVCNLRYSRFRVIVINDRSTDRTPEILQRMALKNPVLEVITISQLPKGWLGKNHALYQGYRASDEEWLLFTDADVKFAPEALSKAMHYALQHDLDHLTALPQVTSRSALFRSVMNTFALMLNIRLRPWAVSDPSSGASIGVGAFNLVKRTAYKKAGTHTVISLRPDDDLKLGERVKKAGLKQDVVYGQQELWLEWYTSLGQFINGLMKNTFSVSNYRLPVALGTAVATLLIFVLPVPVLLFAGYPFYLMALLILLSQVAMMVLTKGGDGKWWHALLIPFAGLVMVYIIVKSAFLTIRQGGIYWRDSFYPLAELKKQS